MPNITVEGGASNWRDLFLDHPGLAPTPENHDRLLAELEAKAAPEPEIVQEDVPEPAPEPEPEPEPEPPAAEPEPEPVTEVPPPPPVSAVKADHVDYVTGVIGVPAEEAAAMTKPELVELARSADPAAPEQG